MNTADTYYLKALEAYPYNMQEAMESLTYGLAYNNEHPALLCLMGEICMEQLKEFDRSETYFNAALGANLHFTGTYEPYIRLLLRLEQFEKAGRLIAQALKVPGINKYGIYYWHAALLEKQEKYEEALAMLDTCRKHCYNKYCSEFLDGETDRIKKKRLPEKKNKKKKKSKKING
jgi:tetratricopeptide (TPR) repeat protein